MRKKILTFLLLALSAHSFAQQASDYQFTIHFNPTFSWFSSDNKTLTTRGVNLGLDGGLDIDKFFASNYAFNTGISLGSFGGFIKPKQTATDPLFGTFVQDTSVKVKIQYLTIPLGFKFKTEKIGLLTYYAQIGINNQFKIKATAYSDDADIDGASVSDDVSFYNFGYYIGAGAEYKLTTSSALVGGITYSSYFSDILTSAKYSVYQRNIALRFGIRF
jgi:opacity protein-like surface antigen